MAGRPRKTDEVEVQEAQAEVMTAAALPQGTVKQIVRKISTQGMSIPELSIDTIYDVDAYLSQWLDAGYEVKMVTYMGTDPNGSFDFHYLLVKTQ